MTTAERRLGQKSDGKTKYLTDDTARAAEVIRLLNWITALALAGVVVTALPALCRVFGLIEQIVLFSTALWFLGLAAGLTLISSPQ